jgi:hypothetical protein
MGPYMFRSFVFFVLVLSSACNGTGPIPSEHNLQVDRLESTLARCIAVEVENHQQLLDQLTQQGEQLDAMQAQQSSFVEDEKRHTESTAAIERPPLCAAQEDVSAKLIVGRQEQVWLEDIQLALPARVDTGAETASLDAHNIELFERNGKRWVRFEILHPESAEPLQLERRLKRIASVIQSNTSQAEKRPVIKLGIKIGHVGQSAEFTLSNRSHLDYQMLIGRNILKDVMIVDVSQINIAVPEIDE